MGKNGARVCSVLPALTCAWAVACGAGGGTASDEGDLQLARADVSVEEAAALEAALCASYRDEGSLPTTSVTVRNDRASAIYLARARGHAGCPGRALFDVAHEGALLDVQGASDCAHPSCESLQDEGDDGVACVDRCADAAPFIRLEPGATLDAGIFDGEYRSAAMPARCLARGAIAPDAGAACVSKHALSPGHYRVSARAFTTLECDGQRSCECARSAEGWCLLDRRHLSRGPALEAALQLELPADSATLVFTER